MSKVQRKGNNTRDDVQSHSIEELVLSRFPLVRLATKQDQSGRSHILTAGLGETVTFRHLLVSLVYFWHKMAQFLSVQYSSISPNYKIPLLGISLSDVLVFAWNDTNKRLFFVALMVVAKSSELYKCPSTENFYSMQYFMATKETTDILSVLIWPDLQDEQKKPDTEQFV